MQQSSLYLVKEFDNFPVFSNENSGRFDESLIDPHETYYVHGLDVVTSSAGSSVAKVLESPSPSPYGAQQQLFVLKELHVHQYIAEKDMETHIKRL